VDALDALIEVFGPQLDPDNIENLDQRIASWAIPAYGVVQRYFRAEVTGLERIPKDAALLVGNHNSGITFLEPIILGREWHRFNGGPDDLRFLVHDAMVAIPVLGNLLMKSGAVRSSREAVGRAFEAGRKILVFPGGNIEAFRPWKDRHKIVFRGHKGFARMALRHGTPVVPVMNLGGHNTFMVLWRGEPLAKLTRVDKLLRSPSFPLFLGLPWGLGFGPIFHFPLPAKMTIEIGEPIPVDQYGAGAEKDDAVVDELYHLTVNALQGMMDRHVGRK
jgi:1-acyl-sn-glycerol-3-phosphate acyltransferase